MLCFWPNPNPYFQAKQIPSKKFCRLIFIGKYHKLFAYLQVGRYICANMDTRQEIIQLADTLIRVKGYNAFSFSDIGKELQIKNASIHYHFPSKKNLGLAIVSDHIAKLDKLIYLHQQKDPTEKLKSFFAIYTEARKEDQICLIGSLATDFYTVDPEIQKELKALTDRILNWVIEILEEGKAKGLFRFELSTRTKALMIITNMLAALQLTRLTNKQDFDLIKQTIINDLTNTTQ
jgi:TetR/AcrR family transcriptional regulator, transcriptional repressor for nem operon